jgi:hypothetical protein
MAKVIPQPSGPAIIQLQDPTQYQQIRPDDPANAVTGAYVWGPGIPPGTNLAKFGLLDQLEFFLSTGQVESSGDQYVELTFTGKNIPPQGLGGHVTSPGPNLGGSSGSPPSSTGPFLVSVPASVQSPPIVRATLLAERRYGRLLRLAAAIDRRDVVLSYLVALRPGLAERAAIVAPPRPVAPPAVRTGPAGVRLTLLRDGALFGFGLFRDGLSDRAAIPPARPPILDLAAIEPHRPRRARRR